MTTKLTTRGAIEIASHEGVVLEAYLDSVGIWTWGIGVTDASGHRVSRYKDKPSSVERAVEVFQWLLDVRYVPDVLDAFDGRTLTEAQLAAATSFHYNTGAIERATWVKLWLAGKVSDARESFLEWRFPPEILPRRQKEAALFFDGKWGDGQALIYPVRKPSYRPDFAKGRRVDIRGMLA